MTGATRAEISDALQQCIRCGMCLEACPTYGLDGLETESPRGRIHLMQALFEERIAPDPETGVHIDRCLGCRACEVVCPSGVRYGWLLEETRAHLAPPALPLAVRALLWTIRRPRALAVAAATLRAAERLGLRALARAVGPARLRRIEALAPSPRPRRLRSAAPSAAAGASGARAGVLLGCVMRVAYGDVHAATARLLTRAGTAVVDLEGQVCCGAMHAHAGRLDDTRALARANIAAVERSGVDLLVVDAAGCGAHLKGLASLFPDDPNWRARAVRVAAMVRDVTEHLAATLDGPLGRLELRATYQDACHLAHAQGIRAQPRALLRRVEGLELVEHDGADVCCGSAGFYNLAQPEYADRLGEAKVAAILRSGARAVVTANPGCMLQIAAGLRAAGSDVEVLHIAELLDRAAAAR